MYTMSQGIGKFNIGCFEDAYSIYADTVSKTKRKEKTETYDKEKQKIQIAKAHGFSRPQCTTGVK